MYAEVERGKRILGGLCKVFDCYPELLWSAPMDIYTCQHKKQKFYISTK